MREKLSQILSHAQTRRDIKALSSLSSFLRTLPASDKLILAVLALGIIVSSALGLEALMRSVMVEVPSRGGTLSEGVVGAPRFANPLLALSDADRDVVALTYAGLMGYDADGSLAPVLAESYVISEDGLAYTFTLRDDARFSDGRPVTADDVVFTITRAQDPGLKSPELANWANIAVTATDARTVEFRLPQAYAPFLEETTLGILPAHLWRDITNEEFPFSTYMTEPVGAGPFKVTRVVRSRSGSIEAYELSAFSDYALGRPYLDSIRLSFFGDDEELRDAYVRGAIESAHGISAPNAIRAPYARVFGVFFNAVEQRAFTELGVRKALSIAIDRNRLTTETLQGFASPVTGPVPPGSGVNATPVLIPSGEERLPAAREALSEAGWEWSDETNLWSKDGTELVVTLRTSNVPELRAVAGRIQADWQELGVPTTLELYDPASLTQEVIRPRSFAALLFGMVVGQERDLFAFWSSSERNDPGLNLTSYANRSVDSLLAAIRTESDRKEAQADLEEATRLIAEDYPAAFTHAPDFLYAIPRGLRGIALTQVTAPSDRFRSVYAWYRHTQFVWPFLADPR